MGVIRERKIECVTPSRPQSNPESVHSGYTTQEEEDESQENRQRLRQPLRTITGLNLNFNFNITRHTGRRKVQRILNTRFLETLKEENETDMLFETNKSKFQLIMEEFDDALEFLNQYENEREISVCTERLQMEHCNCENPYFNIPRKIRAAINGKKNFPYNLLKTIEEALLAFLSGPNTEYFYFPENCYERMLVHAAAIYNGFLSETVIRDDKRAVKITTGKQIMPQVQHLCDYIVEMKKAV